MEFHHTPVLFSQSLEALSIKPDGVYVDCTAGGGGHSAGILELLNDCGLLVCIDQDPQAVQNLEERFSGRKNVRIVHENFRNIRCVLSSLGIAGADGILADLGVSSHQLDCASRGFSYHSDAPLDMRMSMSGATAAQLVNTLSQSELQRIIYAYGEEKFAPSIARNIVREREKEPIETTLRLADIVRYSMPAAARRDGHPARRTFQALRIAVNGELEILDGAISSMFDSLRPQGRLAVITFHSLEDRAVKKSFAQLCSGCTCPPDFPVCVCGKTAAGKLPCKAKTPTDEELVQNPRSRSAKLRVIEKIQN